MAAHEQTLRKETIIQAFVELNDRLEELQTTGEICLFGGTAMVLAFNARLSTKDVDAVFKPPGIIREAADAVAEKLGLPTGWLNDGVKGFLSANSTYTENDLPRLSHLRVVRPTAEYLLAMKCMAARAPAYDTHGDRDDIAFLATHLGLHHARELLQIVERYYPPERILPKTQFMIEEIMASAADGRARADATPITRAGAEPNRDAPKGDGNAN